MDGHGWSWMVMDGHGWSWMVMLYGQGFPPFPTGFNPAEILDPLDRLDPLRSWWYPRSGSSIGQPGDGPEGPEGPEGTCQARVSNLQLHTCDHTLAWFYTGFIWVCLKIGYTPNEIAIFHRDNDHQPLGLGVHYFQTNPYGFYMDFYGVPEFPQQDQYQYLLNFPHCIGFEKRLEKGLGLCSIGLQLLVMPQIYADPMDPYGTSMIFHDIPW